ncbi:hypothetical protein CYMTET_48621 [Cymbomonas tetramitiformis]|uniref:Large ribosomal subunit protein uL15/eL18 domain-containing protein n=1 Tax=Cymbomonas tetramitiformis TaxID=36881 RepID=A0AAE0BTR1_9CHLO|nr:hypothetical protein CYMTET_48621 [Cymbomonas tetramitiformis]
MSSCGCAQIFKRNYDGWLVDGIKNLNEGLEKRGYVEMLKCKRDDLRRRLADTTGMSAQSITETQQQMENFHTEMRNTLEEMVELKQAIYAEGKGYKFVEVWLTPDLKALKGLLGVKSGAGATYPCVCCDAKKDKFGDLGKTWTSREDLASICPLDPVLPIPLSRIRPCGMHLIHRVDEKICQLIIKLVWSAQNMAQWSQQMRDNNAALLEYFNSPIKDGGLFINGGHCKIDISAKSGNREPGKIPFNGAECNRFEEGLEMAIGKIEGLDLSNKAKLLKICETWKKAAYWLRKPVYKPAWKTRQEDEENGTTTLTDREKAQKAFKEFVEAYQAYAKKITHYMHILYYHSEWVTGGEGECPSMFTTQGFEKYNSLERWIMMRKTMKGEALKGGVATLVSEDGYCDTAPAILELFQWSARMMEYRLHDVHREEQKECFEIDVSVLNALSHASEMEEGEDVVWTENMILARLGLPAGKRIKIMGRGKMTAKNIHLVVSSATRSAREKITENGSLKTDKKCAGKKPVAMQNEETVNNKNKRKRKSTSKAAKRNAKILSKAHMAYCQR